MDEEEYERIKLDVELGLMRLKDASKVMEIWRGKEWDGLVSMPISGIEPKLEEMLEDIAWDEGWELNKE